MARQSKAERLLDKEIDKIYRENCSDIQIDIMDVGKVFAVGKRAHENGKDMKDAIVNFVDTIRRN